ncbi:MAG TPA: dihydroorotase [Thermoanaerobaculia bacterium]|nr:dihydroorotase [Thermoanaerobaculia bacterium]
MTLLLRGGRVVDPSQRLDAVRDILLRDGVVAEIAERIDLGDASGERGGGDRGGRRGGRGGAGRGVGAGDPGVRVLDLEGKVVAPGFLDIHVHLREPGHEHKETVETGTRAAAAGGFTAVACMANTHPVNDTAAVTEHILSQARRHGYARVYPVGAVSKGLQGEELAEIGQLHAAGVVAISDDGRPVASSELLRRALSYARHFALPLVQHAQDLDLSGEGVMHEGVFSARLGMPAIPGAAEDAMVARDLLLVELTGGRYHLQHTSTARSLELIRDAKRRGLDATCEVTPHHLLLTDQEVLRSGLSTDTKMNPPLRSARDRDALVEALADGTVDAIATDHAPHHVDEKRVPFAIAPFGIVGLETAVGLCLDRLVRPGTIDLARLVDLLSCGPARVMALPGGTLVPGSPADVTVLDLEQEWTIDPLQFQSKSRNTPFAGWKGRGAPVLTIVGGRVVEVPAPSR